ncbi:MAG: response regulator [Chitinophagales bacterium]
MNSENYRCEFATTYAQAIVKIDSYNYDCILLDLMLPGGNGLQVLNHLKDIGRQEGVIIIFAKNSTEGARACR